MSRARGKASRMSTARNRREASSEAGAMATKNMGIDMRANWELCFHI